MNGVVGTDFRVDVAEGRGSTEFRITVICCAQNGEHHLPRLWPSMQAASGPGVEILLVDDASTDGTGAVLDRWAGVLPNTRVRHRRQSRGNGAAKDDAVSEARGEYVWIVDCDDHFPFDAVEVLTAAAEQHDADVVVARATAVDTAGVVLNEVEAGHGVGVIDAAEAMSQLLSGRIEGYTWTKLFRRALFDHQRFADAGALPRLTTQEDLCRTATAIARSRRVLLVDHDVYRYVRHGASLMDRGSPPLHNLQSAHDHVVGLAEQTLPRTVASRRLMALFTVRMLATSAIKIPIYVNAGRRSRRVGLQMAGRAVRGLRMRDVFALDRRRFVEALLIRINPGVYAALFAHRESGRSVRRNRRSCLTGEGEFRAGP